MVKIKLQAPERVGYFTKLVDQYLEKRANISFPRSQVIRPSTIAQCTRTIVCDLLELLPQEKITPRQQRIFDNGDLVHKRYLESYLPHLGCAAKILVANKTGKMVVKDFTEITIKDPDLWIKCRPDAVIINREENQPYILEIKSIKQEYFDTLSYPDPAYIQQVHLYMYVTQIPRAIVFYECKNKQQPKEFVIQQDDQLLASLIQKIKTIQKFVLEYPTTHQLPEVCDDSSCICRKVKNGNTSGNGTSN